MANLGSCHGGQGTAKNPNTGNTVKDSGSPRLPRMTCLRDMTKTGPAKVCKGLLGTQIESEASSTKAKSVQPQKTRRLSPGPCLKMLQKQTLHQPTSLRSAGCKEALVAATNVVLSPQLETSPKGYHHKNTSIRLDRQTPQSMISFLGFPVQSGLALARALGLPIQASHPQHLAPGVAVSFQTMTT